jgi:hypothetical protein
MAKVKKGYGIMTMKIRGQFPTNVTSIVFQKHYCEFHYSDYAQTNPDEVVKSFYTLVDEAVQNTKPHHMDSCHNPHPHIFETLLWDIFCSSSSLPK